MASDDIKVLVVDDDEDDYVLVRAALEEVEAPCHRVEWVASFDDGERAILENNHDVYLIDYHLGQRNGLDLVRSVIAKGCRKPLIMLTGQGGREVDMEATRAGAADYLLKGEINAALIERSVRYAISHFRTREELRGAKETAEEATRLKDKFLVLVSHDLKSPLVGLYGFLALARDEVAGTELVNLKNYLGVAHGSAKRMLDMITELLKVERFKTGKIEATLETVDMHELALEVLEIQAPFAARKEVGLKSAIGKGVALRADRTLAAEVLQNLVANAIKFCRAGDHITIFQPEGKRNVIAVADTGIGIGPGMLPHLFSYEEKTTTRGTAGETGTGFGLPLSHDIMKAHGGDLRVESAEGKGSTFYMAFPEEGA